MTRARLFTISILTLVGFGLLPLRLLAQQDTLSTDTLALAPVVVADTLPPQTPSMITSDVTYSARDSIVLEGTQIAYLYGDAHVKYESLELSADFIRLRLDSSLVYASGIPDSTGTLKGTPVFKDGNESYQSKAMEYNFKSRKGFTWGTVTQQGEGYVTSGKTKKVSDDEFCLQSGRYTTCDQHDHPHFYLALTKAKMKQSKYLVSGPAYMVVEDVPVPLAIPFGYFPINQKYASGILFPTFGEEETRGFYAKDFGYYFAINDYVDLALTADIYTKGSWAVNMASSYKWRYKFGGSFNLSYMHNTYGDKYTPDYTSSSDFRVMWSHTQDPKMSPYTQFSASVNFSTSSYERNNINSYYNPNLLSQNTKSSTITLTQQVPETPLSFSASMYVTQRTSDSTISLQLPSLTMSVSRVYPFKRKEAVGKERWYEKIAFTYNMALTNSVTAKESQFLHTQFLRDWKNGVKHELPISASFTLFKYLNMTLGLNNSLKWYFQRTNQHWEGDVAGKAVADTTYGFYNLYSGNVSLSMQTQLFGFYKLKSRKGQQTPIFRHRLTPSVSLSYAPDYGSKFWGYWDSYLRPCADGSYQEVYYDRYAGGVYGGSESRGKRGMVTFSVANNLEMKYWSRRDTTGQAKKATIIDNLSFGSGYNMMADSLNWSNINTNIRLKFGTKFTLNLDCVFDPYTYQLNAFGSPVRVDVSQLSKNHVLGRLQSTGTSFGYTFSNETFKKKKDKEDQGLKKKDDRSELDHNMASLDPMKTDGERQKERERWREGEDDYQKFSMPWTLNVNYTVRYAYADFNYDIMEYNRKLTHNISLSGNISFTPTWHLSVSSYYDITNKTWSYVNCTLSKDLHCWTMTCSFVPVGTYTTYNFMIGVKSTLLQDLKYTKEKDTSDNIKWY